VRGFYRSCPETSTIVTVTKTCNSLFRHGAGLTVTSIAPDRSAKRAEVMVMLYHFIMNDKPGPPGDSILLSRTDEMLKAMESAINGDGQVDLTAAVPSQTTC